MSHIIDWDLFYRRGLYRTAWHLSTPAPELLSFLRANPPGVGDAALDLGCGTGSDVWEMAARGYEAHGIDISSVAIDLAQQRGADGLRASFWQGDVLTLPFPSRRFHLLTDRGCFHHLLEDERSRYACEAARVLHPGGRLFLRGCKEQRVPFNPVTYETIREHFPEPLFELASASQLELHTDAGAIAGAQYTLIRTGSL